MTIQHLEQLHQGQRWSGLAIFIAREGVDAPAENLGGLTLIEVEPLADLGDVGGIDVGGVDLPLELPDQLAVAVALLTVQDNLATGWAEVAGHRRDDGTLPLVNGAA